MEHGCTNNNALLKATKIDLTNKDTSMSTAVISMSTTGSAVGPVSNLLKKNEHCIGDGENLGCTNAQIPHLAEQTDYSSQLEMYLFPKTELVLDFSSLKSCLDPNGDPVNDSSNKVR